jgi:hypothetical protein
MKGTYHHQTLGTEKLRVCWMQLPELHAVNLTEIRRKTSCDKKRTGKGKKSELWMPQGTKKKNGCVLATELDKSK